MFRVVGFITATILVLVTSPYWFRQLNKYLFHLPPKKVGPILKKLRLMHKPLGLTLLAIAATHGYMALLSIQWHTGTLAWLGFVATASLGIAYYYTKKPPVFKWHKGAALVAVLLVLTHLFFPNLLYYLMR